MKKAKIGLIGILKEEMKQDFWGTMEKLANIGYQGIEGVGAQFMEGNVAENVKKLHALGLKVLTYSANKEQLQNDLGNIIHKAHMLETNRISVWWGPCTTKEELLKDAQTYNEVGKKLAAEGIKLCYHNHEHEFINTFNGLYGLDILAAYTDPNYVYFELDIAWITFGGADPVEVLGRYKNRVPAIHVKDLYSLSQRGLFTAVGTGVIKVKESVQTAIDQGVEWIVIEQDELRNLTELETVTAAYLNMKEAGLIYTAADTV